MTRTYELTYIVKPDLDAPNLERLIERINEYIRAEKGEIVKLSRWGMRAFAYPIRRYREGHYIFCLVNLEAPAVARLENRLRLQEDVLRYLLVRADQNTTAPKALEPAAHHEQAGPTDSEAELPETSA
ncbi:MAG: 30S ribosomal protein S6 [Thermoflexales bacterium]